MLCIHLVCIVLRSFCVSKALYYRHKKLYYDRTLKTWGSKRITSVSSEFVMCDPLTTVADENSSHTQILEEGGKKSFACLLC